MVVGGVDTYYDYDEKRWKSRRLGGGPIRRGPVCPEPKATEASPQQGTRAGRASYPRTVARGADAENYRRADRNVPR